MLSSNNINAKSIKTESNAGNSKITYNYVIKKYNSKGNYLYLVYDCFLPVVVENTELGENNSFLIGIILIIVVFIVLILVLLIISMCYCKRNQKSKTFGTVIFPNSFGYSVSPYDLSPGVIPPVQVDVQQVMNGQRNEPNYPQNKNNNENSNVQYEQINQAQSEQRVNQSIIHQKYEKNKK